MLEIINIYIVTSYTITFTFLIIVIIKYFLNWPKNISSRKDYDNYGEDYG